MLSQFREPSTFSTGNPFGDSLRGSMIRVSIGFLWGYYIEYLKRDRNLENYPPSLPLESLGLGACRVLGLGFRAV